MKSSKLIVTSVFILCSMIILKADLANAAGRFAPGPIKIMTYNLENLFDAQHDRDKRDYEFLPKNHPEKRNCSNDAIRSCEDLDWTSSKLSMKLKQIKKVIDAQGTLPDILVVEEIENDYVARGLATTLGFRRHFITDSPDERGIDVAILFNEDRLRLINKVERKINIHFETRDFLAVNFETAGGEILGVFANHWPSQLTPDTGVRVEVARQLRQFVDSTSTRFSRSDYHVILTGDFNTLKDDDPHPFKEVILNKNWRYAFQNVRYLYQKQGGEGYPGGTFFYDKEAVWNEFDIFFASNNLTDGKGLEVIPESYRVNMPDFATKIFEGLYTKTKKAVRVPFEYDHNATRERDAGYSDHFGIVVKIDPGVAKDY